MTLIVALLGSLCLLIIGPQAAARAQAQTPAAAVAAQERERGVELYKQGNIKEAVKALRAAIKLNKKDGEAWHFLSLALNRDGDRKGARKAVEKAVQLRPDFAPARAGLAYFLLLSNKLPDALREAGAALALDPQNAEAHYVASTVHLRRDELARALEEVDAALMSKPDFAAAYLLRSQVLLVPVYEGDAPAADQSPEARAQRIERSTSRLKQAAESLEKYFQLNPSPPDAESLREQLASLKVYAQNLTSGTSSADRTVFLPTELTTKARILTRPEPQYTEDARKANVKGMVMLRAVFAADGTVQNILVIRGLPHGLTEKAIKAARKITFVPATKDGRPVSQFIQIEYNFYLY